MTHPAILRVLTFLCPLAASLAAAPRITEFVAINAQSRADGDGNTPDWIEIHNPEAAVLDLSGYHLTDDPEIPNNYTFPAGTSIAGGGYLLVFASGREESDYVDAGGFLHTNFSLRGSGEYLALKAPDGSSLSEFAPFPAQFEDISYGEGDVSIRTTLLAEGAAARWQVPTTDPGEAWRSAVFDDGAWTPAFSGIGYGYPDEVGEGGDTRSAMWFSNASVLIRFPFEVVDPAAVSTLSLQLRYEDGFVAWVNGEPVAAANAPAPDDLAFDSTATAPHPDEEAVVPENFPISPEVLVPGTNVLAIQGLNLSATGSNSSDFLILPELVASEIAGVGTLGYFQDPTPGGANGVNPLGGYVADTKFSRDRGYHSEPFELEITTATPGTIIVYTTDGSEPTEEHGFIYTAPISIASTATIRAMAFRENFLPTNVDTQTYLFVEDLIRQNRPPGYPATWAGVTADYEMDPEIVNDPDYADDFEEAFAALPALSLVFDPDALFHPVTGIYQRPQSEGSAWERPLSAEFFLPDDSEPGFQIDAGIRIQGGSSRNPDTPKHSLSLRFRADYGNEKLRYPLYRGTPSGESAVEEFDLLQLRPEYNFGWMHRHYYQAEHALYGRDQWTSDLFLAMGRNGSHGRWVHLYLNGMYWGLYDLHERPDADHMANYFGGDDDDYDTVNSSRATKGDLVAFNQMMNLAYSSIATPATYAAIQEYLDVGSFIDYMILNAYIGNRDWDGHNWRAARRREPGAHYLFFPWDSEFAVSHVGGGVFTPPDFYRTALSTNVTGRNGNRRPTGLQQRLAGNAEYRLHYADRVRAHFFNDGPLTPAKATALWTRRSKRIQRAIVAESARWGDFRRDVLPGRWNSSQFDLYTRDDHYLPTLNWLINTYLPQRTDIVFNQLRSRNLYPSLDAPDFARHGGTVPRGFQLEVNGPSRIFYTLDGRDPRQVGGTINPDAASLTPGDRIRLDESLILKARARSSAGQWSALTEASFTVAAASLVISEIMYHPESEPLAEFLEIHNPGDFAVSLTGLRLIDGIDFDFDLRSSIKRLEAGERLLLVRDREAFQRVYGTVFDSQIAGTFQNDTALANGGESLAVADANGEVVLRVRYDDESPWPTSSDGQGRSLVFTGGQLENPINWRPSRTVGGNPGDSDVLPFQGGSLSDYVLAGSTTFVQTASGHHLQCQTVLGADEVELFGQYSRDLKNWTTLTAALLEQELTPDGLGRIIRIGLPDGARGYGRVLMRRRE